MPQHAWGCMCRGPARLERLLESGSDWVSTEDGEGRALVFDELLRGMSGWVSGWRGRTWMRSKSPSAAATQMFLSDMLMDRDRPGELVVEKRPEKEIRAKYKRREMPEMPLLF